MVAEPPVGSLEHRRDDHKAVVTSHQMGADARPASITPPQFIEPPSALLEPPPEIGNFAFAGLGGRVLELGLEIAQALVYFVTQDTDAGAPNAVARYIESV